MSKADQIRRAFADPAVRAQMEREQEAVLAQAEHKSEREQAKAVKAVRRLAKENPGAEVDVLVGEIAKLIPAAGGFGAAGLDGPVTMAIIRELLPSYLGR